ncbi:uncharacterized protein LOC117315919 [Pecten maximus]|uniref:uncharacterized protein LOC117315919 n=1 Tax=Pecten maximus TaxID=6579 RepID=UPI001458D77A|nr:uncharacterized protein LOC117315919 [Pecten maximus]
MSRHANIFRSTSCKLFTIYGSLPAWQQFRNTPRRCVSTLRNRKTQCQSSTVLGILSASRIETGSNRLILQNICIPAFNLSIHKFSTSTNRYNGGASPGKMKRQLQEGMYGEGFRGRMFDIRNSSKLVTSFPHLPVYEINRKWMLHVFPSYYLGQVGKGFSAGEFMGGADMAVEPILASAGSGNFDELYDFMDEETIAEMMLNRKNINTELLSMLSEEVIFDMSFVNERTLCSYEIEQLQDKGCSRVSITGILRGDAMISTAMGKTLNRIISPTWMKKPQDIPMDIDIHFMFRCSRQYTYDEPHRDWTIDGFTFLIDVPELFIAYIL